MLSRRTCLLSRSSGFGSGRQWQPKTAHFLERVVFHFQNCVVWRLSLRNGGAEKAPGNGPRVDPVTQRFPRYQAGSSPTATCRTALLADTTDFLNQPRAVSLPRDDQCVDEPVDGCANKVDPCVAADGPEVSRAVFVDGKPVWRSWVSAPLPRPQNPAYPALPSSNRIGFRWRRCHSFDGGRPVAQAQAACRASFRSRNPKENSGPLPQVRPRVSRLCNQLRGYSLGEGLGHAGLNGVAGCPFDGVPDPGNRVFGER